MVSPRRYGRRGIIAGRPDVILGNRTPRGRQRQGPRIHQDAPGRYGNRGRGFDMPPLPNRRRGSTGLRRRPSTGLAGSRSGQRRPSRGRPSAGTSRVRPFSRTKSQRRPNKRGYSRNAGGHRYKTDRPLSKTQRWARRLAEQDRRRKNSPRWQRMKKRNTRSATDIIASGRSRANPLWTNNAISAHRDLNKKRRAAWNRGERHQPEGNMRGRAVPGMSGVTNFSHLIDPKKMEAFRRRRNRR